MTECSTTTDIVFAVIALAGWVVIAWALGRASKSQKHAD
jgi:hypothetical protein